MTKTVLGEPRKYNPYSPYLVPLSQAEPHIRSGDLGSFRGRRFHSLAIMVGTFGLASHSSMLYRRPNDGCLRVLHTLEGRGAVDDDLADTVRQCPGTLDVFAPDRLHFPEFDARRACAYMLEQIRRKRPYGIRGIWRLLLMRAVFIRWLWLTVPQGYDYDDESNGERHPFCSHLVAAACKRGGVDPVPNKADHFVTPNDLTWTALYGPGYRFTLVPDDANYSLESVGAAVRPPPMIAIPSAA